MARQWLIIASAQKQTRQQLSKTSSIPASIAEKERKTIKTRWKKADSRLKKMCSFTRAQGTFKIRCNFKFHLTQNTHKMLLLIVHFAHYNKPIYKSSLCTHLGMLQVAHISSLIRDRIHSIDALCEPITDLLVGHWLQEGAVSARKRPLPASAIIRIKEALNSLCAGTHPDTFVHSSTRHPLRCR